VSELNELATALAKAQAEITAAKMNAVNPFFNSRYATLAAVWDAVREPLTKNGLSVVQLPTSDGKIVTLTTMLLHASGQRISSKITAPLGQAKNPVQGMGSTITYLRRYALAALCGVVSDEDADGNSAVVAQKKQKSNAVKKVYGTPESFLRRVNEKTDAYYKNIPHLKTTLGGNWPDWTDRDAVAEAGKAAIAYVVKKHLDEANEQKPLFTEKNTHDINTDAAMA